MESIKDLLDPLNATNECTNIEAKRDSAIDKSIREKVCSLSNEPGLGRGYKSLGVKRNEATLIPVNEVSGITDPDKLQLDLVTQCASMINQTIRPEVEIEKLTSGKLVVQVLVSELSDAQKPLYLKRKGLRLGYTIPEMPNHPDQAYKIVTI